MKMHISFDSLYEIPEEVAKAAIELHYQRTNDTTVKIPPAKPEACICEPLKAG